MTAPFDVRPTVVLGVNLVTGASAEGGALGLVSVLEHRAGSS